ncbi:MAG: hypothetical protein AVDCRST_MAG66-3188, partial [uncultured Pseudonocardia sp.]
AGGLLPRGAVRGGRGGPAPPGGGPRARGGHRGVDGVRAGGDAARGGPAGGLGVRRHAGRAHRRRRADHAARAARVRRAARRRSVHGRRGVARGAGGHGRRAGVRGELRPYRARRPGGHRRARHRHRPARRRRLLGAQRLPHLARLRGQQLAGPRHVPVRPARRRPGAAPRARGERPAHPPPCVPRRRLAHGRGHARHDRRLAGGGVLRPRAGARPRRARLPGPRPGLGHDPRPVLAGAVRAHPARWPARLRRDRAGVGTRAVALHPARAGLGRRRGRLGVRPDRSARGPARRGVGEGARGRPGRLRGRDGLHPGDARVLRRGVRRRRARPGPAGRPPAAPGRGRPGRRVRRAGVDRDPVAGGARPRGRLGLVGGAAPGGRRAGVADGGGARPVPGDVQRLRSDRGGV